MSDFKPNVITRRRENGTLDVATLNDEASMTQQQFAAECDINNIMKKYNSTGEFTHLTSKQGQYADFSQITDYRDMLDTVRYAQEAFSSLPADVRLKFRNDPGELLAFLQDEKNYDEGVKLGLINARKIDENALNKNDLNDQKIAKTSKQRANGPKNDSTPAEQE